MTKEEIGEGRRQTEFPEIAPSEGRAARGGILPPPGHST